MKALLPEFDFMGAVAAAILYFENDQIIQIKVSRARTIQVVGEGDTSRESSKLFNINFPVASRIPATATLASADPARALG